MSEVLDPQLIYKAHQVSTSMLDAEKLQYKPLPQLEVCLASSHKIA